MSTLAFTDQNDVDKLMMRLKQSYRISRREFTVMKLVVAGHSNKNIALNLGLAESTVKVHLKAIFGKIGVRNRTQVALWLMAQQLSWAKFSDTNISTGSSVAAQNFE